MCHVYYSHTDVNSTDDYPISYNLVCPNNKTNGIDIIGTTYNDTTECYTILSERECNYFRLMG